MACLLLRCVGPMQSWGSRSRFQERDTEREPTKSGIVGLLCAALGRDRTEPLGDLVALRMGVRVDMEGRVETDYHTALDVLKANRSGTDTQISNRAYLADAAFLVGLEGDYPLLERLQSALQNPRWPLFLGRKSFVPGCPVFLKNGLRQNETLEVALKHYDSIAAFVATTRKRTSEIPQKARLILESRQENSIEWRLDSPMDFRHLSRRFEQRHIQLDDVDSKPFREDACI